MFCHCDNCNNDNLCIVYLPGRCPFVTAWIVYNSGDTDCDQYC